MAEILKTYNVFFVFYVIYKITVLCWGSVEPVLYRALFPGWDLFPLVLPQSEVARRTKEACIHKNLNTVCSKWRLTHLCVILLTWFPTSDKSCDFQADIIQFDHFKQWERILTACNPTVRWCSPSYHSERRLTHLWNSYSWLRSPQKISPVIFRLISLNLTI